MSTDAEQLAALAAWNLKDPERRINLPLTAEEAWVALSMIQFSTRHPDCPIQIQHVAVEICFTLVELIAPTDGPLRDLALRGFDPGEDE